jgi:hypothetical protein
VKPCMQRLPISMTCISLEAFRGQRLSTWLRDVIRALPDLQGLQRWSLLPADAHGFSQKERLTSLQHPERFLDAST